jgi:enoyl-[acyl-carrier protein] reductase I
MGLLSGKKAVIFGVANERSIAWAMAKKFHDEGAELAFAYAGEALKSRVVPLAESVGAKLILPCDVTKDDEIDAAFLAVEKEWGSIDVLVHSLAFANKEELKGAYVDTSREGFRLALDVSAYSLVALSRRAALLMEKKSAGAQAPPAEGEDAPAATQADNGSIITLTYYGAEKVVPNYNVMGVAKAALEASVIYLAEDLGRRGIRVNAISAGPIKTLAAMGISGFKSMLDLVSQKAPLRRNVTQEDVAGTALYLASNLSSGVTGENVYVDCGYNIKGM